MLTDRRLSKPPRDVAESVEKEAERAERFIRQRKMHLGPNQIEDIEKDLDKKFESWKRQTGAMRKKLIELNDLLEGVVEETNFPFEGASNMTLHYAAGVERTFRSVFNRTFFLDPNIFVARLASSRSGPEMQGLQDAVNETFANETNGLDTLKDGTTACFRDGTLIIMGTWERRIERGHDSRIYSSDKDFIKDYPDATATGLSEEEYDSVLDFFLTANEPEVKIDYGYDFVEHDGPEYEIIPLARFVCYPVWAPSIRRMTFYGRLYYLTKEEVETKGKRGYFYKSAAERIKAKDQPLVQDDWSASRHFIEGLSPTRDEKRPIELIDGVYKTDLDDDGIPEKYLVTYATAYKVLCSMEPYPLRRNLDFCVDFRFIKRDDRFFGISILGTAQDLFELMDTIHRHRNNVRMLVTSPVFMGQNKYKDQIDLGRFENVIRPGLTIWVDDIDKSFKQLQMHNFDQPGNSMDEESLVVRYIELTTGTTQGLSGKSDTRDPRSPASKTLALLQQSNQRIDDYIDEYMKGIPALAELHVALYYQYGPSEGIRVNINRDGRPAEISVAREILADLNVRWVFPKRSVTLSPEYVQRRLSTLMVTFEKLLPLMLQNVPQATELWNRLVLSSGEPDVGKLLWKGGPPQVPPLTGTPQGVTLPAMTAPQPIPAGPA